MATASEILRDLNLPKECFNKLYTDFIYRCPRESDMRNIETIDVTRDLIATLKNLYTVPLLIEKLLTEGSVAFHQCNLSLYHLLYKDNNDLLLDYTTIEANPELKATYLDNGRDISTFAMATAQYWMMQQAEHKEMGNGELELLL